MIERQKDLMSVIEQATSPLSQFLYASKAPETKRQWPNRLKVVFDFLGLAGSLDEQAKQFMILVPHENALIIAGKIPGAWLVQIKDAGHAIMVQYPAEVAEILNTFLSTVPNNCIIH
jgi:pimeloyl-ACP methyl ester carboxylesterase